MDLEEKRSFIMRSDEPKRDWEEDFPHENGTYMCTCYKCKNTFYGYKRRVICKLCLDSQAASIHSIPTGQQSNSFQDEYQKGLDW